MANVPQRTVNVSVHDLVDFVLRSGDARGGRRFVSPWRGLEGTWGHQRLQSQRPSGYQREVPVTFTVEDAAFTLVIRGRIDGILATGKRLLLEEIKTIEGMPPETPDPLHWAQAKVYGSIYCHQHGLTEIDLQLTYWGLQTEESRQWQETFSRAELERFFNGVLDVYREWAADLAAWRDRRDLSIRQSAFPYDPLRPGQQALIDQVGQAISAKQRLFAEAPTGIGKTLAVWYPAIQALSTGEVDQLFFLTAKTLGRGVAEDALADLRGGGLRIRTLTLTAREKICVREGAPCDPATCPWARGYYDRRLPALWEAVHEERIDRPTLERIAARREVCPFELGLDATDWVDAILADYNHLFDPQASLRRLLGEPKGRYAVLIDEAHNLVDRAREMFSADLTDGELREARELTTGRVPSASRALGHALRLFEASLATAEGGSPSPGERGVCELPALPEGVREALERFAGETASWLSQSQDPDPPLAEDRLIEVFYRVHHFLRIAERLNGHYVALARPAPQTDERQLRLFCVDPAPELQRSLNKVTSAIFFSGTLTPLDYYRRLLGGRPDDPVVRLDSAFPPQNLGILVADRIATHFQARQRTAAQVADAIVRFVRAKIGNYLVFFPSYTYLNTVLPLFNHRFQEGRVLVQTPAMREPDREAFLKAFDRPAGTIQVGFAVMGGLFGEAIDLMGDRLVGAVVVGVGLPQISAERNRIRGYFEDREGSGFDYAYTYPGWNRVLQAVGRVIRSEEDRGAALLIDQRLAEMRYRKLYPPWWQPVRVGTPKEIAEAMQAFWV